MLAKMWGKGEAMIASAKYGSVTVAWLRRIGPAVLGGGVGYAYYRFIGCASGSCAITSNPWLSILFGAIIGASFVPKKPASG